MKVAALVQPYVSPIIFRLKSTETVDQRRFCIKQIFVTIWNCLYLIFKRLACDLLKKNFKLSSWIIRRDTRLNRKCNKQGKYRKNETGDVISVIVILVRNGISESDSNLGLGCLHFTSCECPSERHASICSPPPQLWINSGTAWVLWPWFGHQSWKRKTLNSSQLWSS